MGDGCYYYYHTGVIVCRGATMWREAAGSKSKDFPPFPKFLQGSRVQVYRAASGKSTHLLGKAVTQLPHKATQLLCFCGCGCGVTVPHFLLLPQLLLLLKLPIVVVEMLLLKVAGRHSQHLCHQPHPL